MQGEPQQPEKTVGGQEPSNWHSSGPGSRIGQGDGVGTAVHVGSNPTRDCFSYQIIAITGSAENA